MSFSSPVGSGPFSQSKPMLVPTPPGQNNLEGSRKRSLYGQSRKLSNAPDTTNPGGFQLPAAVVETIFIKNESFDPFDDPPSQKVSSSRRDLDPFGDPPSQKVSSSRRDLYIIDVPPSVGKPPVLNMSARQISCRSFSSSERLTEEDESPLSLDRVCNTQVDRTHGSPIYNGSPQIPGSATRNRVVTFVLP